MSEDKKFPWNIPQGGFLGRPLLGKHKLVIKPAKKEDATALPVVEILKTRQAKASFWLDKSFHDGQVRQIPVPDGSLQAYVEKRPDEYGHPDAYVIIEVEYDPIPGEDIDLSQDKIPIEFRKAGLEWLKATPSANPQ